MPTYEYACAACGHQWEQVQRIVEAPVELCPECKKSTAHRLISGGTNFILKGGGWYSDLYSSKPASKSAEGKPAEPASAGEGSTSTDSTNATAPKKAEPKGGPPPSTGPAPASTASSSSSPAPTSSS
jgi:putative FmdB family regulatory protein